LTTSSVQNRTTLLPLSIRGPFAYDQSRQVIYAVGNDSIAEINASTNQILSIISLGETPVGIAFDNITEILYFSSTYPTQSSGTTGDLCAIRVTSNASPKGYSVEYNQTGFSQVAGGLVFKPTTNYLYFASVGRIGGTWTENVTAIDASNNKIAQNITVGSSSPGFEIGQVTYDPLNAFIYGVFRSVGMDGGGAAIYFAVNTTTNQRVSMQGSFPANFPVSLVSNPSNGEVYISPNWDCAVLGTACPVYPEGNISVIRGNSITSQIRVSNNPNATLGSIVYDSKNGQIYVANGTFLAGSVSQSRNMTLGVTSINAGTGKVTGAMSFPSVVSAVYVNPENEGFLYVATSTGLYVVPIDSGS